MMKIASAALAIASLGAATEQTTADGRKTRAVQLSSDEDLCIFENFDDSWCFAATPPMLKAGWEVKQTWTKTPSTDLPVLEYYQWQLQPYAQIQANLISNLFLQNVWVNVITADLDQFKVNMFISLIINENFEVCPGLGWETQRVLFKILWTMKMWNCSKTLVNDLADFSSTWTGYDAKYFEDCAQSNNVEVIFYEKEIKKANDGVEWYGTTNAKSVKYCTALLGSTSAASLAGENDPAVLMAKMAYKTFFNWAAKTYPESFE